MVLPLNIAVSKNIVLECSLMFAGEQLNGCRAAAHVLHVQTAHHR
jgi:hypothetical protein